jgi:rhamnogalacturonan endolyase
MRASLSIALVLCLALPAAAQRQMEQLDRGVVAVHQGDGRAFVSWRMFGTDPETIAFDVYRQVGDAAAEKLNDRPIASVTWLADEAAPRGGKATYSVNVAGGTPGRDQFTLDLDAAPAPYLWFPVTPPFGYRPNDTSVGDLDGDGQYELVIHMVGAGRDNSQDGDTTTPWLFAYKLDGTRLWRINLGRNIREGAHYTQFMVYDLDGDGRAEVACKTADGTVDGQGKVIGDASANWVNRAGRVLDGPEYLTVFDGRTGAALATTDYIPPRGEIEAWGDNRGNRGDRFLACVAYLDGERPSLVMCRGYYTRCVLAAFNWREGKLSNVWTFDSDDGTPGNDKYRGQGNHGISVADVDADGRDEIIYGSAVIDDNGQGLYATGLGHGDAMHVTDHVPERPGLEVYKANGDGRSAAGIQMRDARTGEQIWGVPSTGRDGVGRACALDIDPRHAGSECWGVGQSIGGLFDAHGARIADRAPRVCNMGAWWDGDLLRELLNGVDVSKWDFERGEESPLLRGSRWAVVSNNGSKSNPCLCADILGDWREEIVAASFDGRAIAIFTTTIPTDLRMPTLMHDPVYRMGVAWQNVSYNQPAHTGFFLGADMQPPARPAIRLTSAADGPLARPGRAVARELPQTQSVFRIAGDPLGVAPDPRPGFRMEDRTSHPDDRLATIHLLDSAQGHVVQTWRFRGKREIVIGRSDDCDVSITDPHVSRTHVKLLHADGVWTLTSTGRHGTLVNDRLVAETQLGRETRFRLGAQGPLLRFESDAHEGRTSETIDSIQPDLFAMLEIDEQRKLQEADDIAAGSLFRELEEQVRRARQRSTGDTEVR